MHMHMLNPWFSHVQVKRMEIASQLWASGIKAEFGFKPNPKMGDNLNYALEQAIPFMVLFGEDEIKNGNVKIKVGEDAMV